MLGLRAADATQREAFFALFNRDNAGAGLFARLDWCLADRTCKWDTARGAFWLKHVLDVVLAAAVDEALPPCTAALAPVSLRRVPGGAVLGGAAAAVSALVGADREFCAAPRATGQQLVAALRTLCFATPQLAYDLWVQIFPQAW